MSPQEKRHGVMARIRTSDLTIERRTLYHLSYPARQSSHSFIHSFIQKRWGVDSSKHHYTYV
jgi:hypothetical protein